MAKHLIAFVAVECHFDGRTIPDAGKPDSGSSLTT
jgi:hypothetical protein